MPKISVIIPVFNVEPFVRRCLLSAINQSFRDIEIIVVDDCGSDKSIDIVRSFNDPRIRIVSNARNLGLLQARIAGVKVALGDYIIFLDSDDFLDLNALEKVYEKAIKSDFDYVSFFYYYYRKIKGIDIKDSSNDPLLDPNYQYVEGPFNPNELEFNNRDDFIKYIKSNSFGWNIWARLIKREKYLQALTYFEDMHINVAEDVIQNYVLWNICNSFAFIKDGFYFYCENPNSLTQNANLKKLEVFVKDHKEVIKKIKELKRVFGGGVTWKYLHILKHEKNRQSAHVAFLKSDRGLFSKIRFRIILNILRIKIRLEQIFYGIMRRLKLA